MMIDEPQRVDENPLPIQPPYKQEQHSLNASQRLPTHFHAHRSPSSSSSRHYNQLNSQTPITTTTTMDWFSWLSKTNLEPTLVYEYGLALSHNELQQEDIPFFNHEFLQSMGISIAKHRLEILKLAKADSSSQRRPVARFFSAIKKTKRYLVAMYLHSLSWVDHRADRDSSALVVVHNRKGSSSSKSSNVGRTWRSTLARARRSKRFVLPEPRRLTITDGRSYIDHQSGGDGAHHVSAFDSPVLDRMGSSPVLKKVGQELEWASLFQDLKPT